MANSSLYGRDIHHNSTLDADEDETFRTMQEYRIAMVLWKYFAPGILLVGTIGSVVSLLVLCQKSMRKQTTMFYLAVLGVADGLVLYVGLLRLWLEKRFDFFIRLESDWACRLHTFVAYVCLDFSVWILVAVSVDRCLFISLPYSAKRWCTLKRARIAVAVIVLFMIIINVHFLWTYRRESDGSSSIAGNEKYRCYVNSDSKVSQRFIKSVWPWLDFCVYCLTPFVIMLGTNVVIVRHLIRSDRTMAAHRHIASSHASGSKSKIKSNGIKDSTTANGDARVVSFHPSEDEEKSGNVIGDEGDGNIDNEDICNGGNHRQVQPNALKLKVNCDKTNTRNVSLNSDTCAEEGRSRERIFTYGVTRALGFLHRNLNKIDRQVADNTDLKHRSRSRWSKSNTAIAPARAKKSDDSFELESVSTLSDFNEPGDAKILMPNTNANRRHVLKGFTNTNKIHPIQSKNTDPRGLNGFISEERSGTKENNKHGSPKTKNNPTRLQGGEAQAESVCSGHYQLKVSFGSMEKDENRVVNTVHVTCPSATQGVSNKTTLLKQDGPLPCQSENVGGYSEQVSTETPYLDNRQLASETNEDISSPCVISSAVTENTGATSTGRSALYSQAKHLDLASAVVSSTSAFIHTSIASNGFQIDEKQTLPEVQSEGSLVISSSFLLSGSSLQLQHQTPGQEQNRLLLQVQGKHTESQSPNSYQHDTQSPNSNRPNCQSPHPTQSTYNRSPIPNQCNTQSQNLDQPHTQSPNPRQPNTQSSKSNSNQPDTQSPKVSRPKKVILPSQKRQTCQNRFTSAGHKQMKASQSPGSNRYNTTSISTTLLAVNVLFWLFNAPIMIYIIGFTYWMREADGYRLAKLELAWAIANILQYSNNAAHIFLYCLTGPRFRKELWSLLRRLNKK